MSGLILLQVSRFRRGERHVGSSVAGVVASLYLAVLFFAAVYYGFAHHAPGSVPGLRTRTDALYFSLTVTSTTGFGDIHAQSQAARAIASVQIAFTIGYLSWALTVLRSRATAR
ncbi:potassium channel family protein [Klebsiella pneumoniae]|nr:potassium channel family protein [Klebsiella pneumoniae]